MGGRGGVRSGVGVGEVRGRGHPVGGQGGCERRSKVFVKIQKEKFFLRVGGSGGWVGVGGRGGSDQGLGVGEVRGSNVWVRWVMLCMGDVNQE